MGKPERIEDALQAGASVRLGEHDRDEDRARMSNVQGGVDTPEGGRARLVRKLSEVMAAVHRIPKRGRNAFHGYDYATETDITEAIRTELAERQVMLIPSVDGIDWRELPPKKDGTARGWVAVMTMTFEFLDGETGASITKRWVGAGEDSGDKSPYKAMTGAVKYFCLKTFLIPTGDDPENDGGKADRQERGKQRRRETTAPDGARVDSDTGEQLSEGEHRPLTVKSVEAKQKKSGTEYWRVVFSDGRSAFTEDRTVSDLARKLQESQAVVAAVTETKNGGLVLVELAKLDAAPSTAKPF